MRKRKSNVKKMSLKTIVLIILFVFFITISVGYSYLKQSLSMTGKSTIIQKSESSGQIINGESTYTSELINAWGGGNSDYIYQIKIEIFNRDADIAEWQLSFDVPDSYNHAGSNIWTASSSSYENGRLTLIAHSWNASVATGTTLTLEFQLAFTQEETELISNLILIDVSLIDSEETETTTPDLGETDTEQIEATTPDLGETGTEQTETTTPESEETDTEQTETTTPELEETNTEQTQTTESEDITETVTNE